MVVGIKILRCAVWKLMLKVVRRKEEEEEEEKREEGWFCKTRSATVATTLLFVVRQWRGGCAGKKQSKLEVAFLSGAHSYSMFMAD